MTDLWTMPRTAPAKPRQAKVDKLTEWDPARLRDEMAASVRDSDKRKDRDPNSYHGNSRRPPKLAPLIMEALTYPMTAKEIADIIGTRQDAANHALVRMAREGLVERVEKVGYSMLWGKVGG